MCLSLYETEMEYRQNSWGNNPTDENGEETKEVNHGNTGLPFGLCAKYGIRLPQNATPRDAWDALEKKGVYPPWTDEGKGQYGDDGKNKEVKDDKSPVEVSNKITDWAKAIRHANAWDEETRQLIGGTIGNLFTKYRLQNLDMIDLATSGKSYSMRANGKTLEIASRTMIVSDDEIYTAFVDRFQKNNEKEVAYINDCIKNADSERWRVFYEKQLNKSLYKFNRSSVSYKGEMIKTILAHETGHIIADQYFGQINGEMCLIEGLSKIPPADAVQIISKAKKEATKNGDIYKISAYAAKNEFEFFAECFAMKEMNKEKLPATVEKMFKELKI